MRIQLYRLKTYAIIKQFNFLKRLKTYAIIKQFSFLKMQTGELYVISKGNLATLIKTRMDIAFSLTTV